MSTVPFDQSITYKLSNMDSYEPLLDAQGEPIETLEGIADRIKDLQSKDTFESVTYTLFANSEDSDPKLAEDVLTKFKETFGLSGNVGSEPAKKDYDPQRRAMVEKNARAYLTIRKPRFSEKTLEELFAL